MRFIVTPLSSRWSYQSFPLCPHTNAQRILFHTAIHNFQGITYNLRWDVLYQSPFDFSFMLLNVIACSSLLSQPWVVHLFSQSDKLLWQWRNMQLQWARRKCPALTINDILKVINNQELYKKPSEALSPCTTHNGFC